MIIVKIYDEKTRMYPSGQIATAERVYNDYPAVKAFTHVILTDERDEVINSIMNLSALRGQFGIGVDVPDEEAVKQIQEAMNTPDPRESEPSPEERQAAALEAIADGQTTENAAALNALLGLE